ncbi:MAG: biotin transporter BioY [Deltaproteobacteria bacterium]|jgi:biotin transport system substrate-specific component|nr:biotin transporter BioY [Deltaproteobacteria bacterium]
MEHPARFTLRETAGAARAALWAALVAAGAFVSLPLGPVPLTLQTFFILLCGFTEGTRAWKPVALYVGAGLLGFPVFSGGVAGPAVLAGPTAGFALSFPLAAYTAGLAAKGGAPGSPSGRLWPRYALYGCLATILVNAAGAVGLHANLSLPWDRAFLAVVPFLPGGALKIAAAVACASAAAARLGLREGPAGGGPPCPGEDLEPERGGGGGASGAVGPPDSRNLAKAAPGADQRAAGGAYSSPSSGPDGRPYSHDRPETEPDAARGEKRSAPSGPDGTQGSAEPPETASDAARGEDRSLPSCPDGTQGSAEPPEAAPDAARGAERSPSPGSGEADEAPERGGGCPASGPGRSAGGRAAPDA